MVFASGIFIFTFLPITVIGNYILRDKSVCIKNAFLLLMSMFFYLESGIGQFLLLLTSILVNYCMALAISHAHSRKSNCCKKLWLVLAIIYNVATLFIFKYLSFVFGELSILFGGVLPEKVVAVTLPLGISFYTFQALSYVIDVYRDSNLVEKKLINVALYISFFPQLVAGPIVRWNSIYADLTRKNRGGYWNEGLERFTIGLAKKVIIANHMAVFADKAFALLDEGNLTIGFAWIGAVAYSLQIYFDFSGYSDMAIGLGRLFGFTFPDNFNYPYLSKSISEFWRRWHISLSRWFRDYVYIPLGGNRCSRERMILNLLVVWTLTGIWHGANYTFWLWGLLYFVFLMIEKMLKRQQMKNTVLDWFRHIYTMLIVIILWVIFRADSLEKAWLYILHMFGKATLSNSIYANGVTCLYFKNFIGYGIIAIIGCFPWYQRLKKFMCSHFEKKTVSAIFQIWIVLIFALSCCVTVDSNYNPFIYFNF